MYPLKLGAVSSPLLVFLSNIVGRVGLETTRSADALWRMDRDATKEISAFGRQKKVIASGWFWNGALKLWAVRPLAHTPLGRRPHCPGSALPVKLPERGLLPDHPSLLNESTPTLWRVHLDRCRKLPFGAPVGSNGSSIFDTFPKFGMEFGS